MLNFLLFMLFICVISLINDIIVNKRNSLYTQFIAFIFGPLFAIRFLFVIILFLFNSIITNILDPLIDSLYSDDDERRTENWKDIPE